jgi:hypothetical protein
MISSFMQFCSDTRKPVGDTYWLISIVAQLVS